MTHLILNLMTPRQLKLTANEPATKPVIAIALGLNLMTPRLKLTAKESLQHKV